MFTRINLYKNCILTARNTEVFRSQSILEEYLETLEKPYTTDIEIPNVYTTLSGTITIDAIPLNGDFNYIKFEEFDDNNVLKQKVYAFIDNFRLINDLYVIEYTTDVWHTYIGTWSLRDSLVINSRWRINNEPYNLPLAYIPNGHLTVKSLDGYTINNTGKMVGVETAQVRTANIIFKIQIYDLVSGGKNTSLVKEAYFVINENINIKMEPTSQSSLATLLDLIETTSNEKVWTLSDDESAQYYINIVEQYIVPEEWGILSKLTNSNYQLGVKAGNTFVYWFYKLNEHLDYYVNSINTGFPVNIPFNTIGVVCFTSLLPFNGDGTIKNIDINIKCTEDTFSVYLVFNGNIYEITDKFTFQQDYKIVTGDVLAQREIARKQQTIQGITGVINGIVKMGAGVATFGASDMSSGVSNAITTLNKFNQKTVANKLASASSLENAVGTGAGIVGGATQIINSVANIAFANANKYLSFIPSDNFTNAIVNAYFGICYVIYNINETVNKNEVINAVRTCGYNVSYFINNLDISNNAIKTAEQNSSYTDGESFNIIRFSAVRITGLSTEICNIIAGILMDGVKIWYTKNV